MGFQLSPGVNVSEIDLTGFVPAVATTGGGFVGQFEWGPVETYQTITDKKKLEQWFGKPSDSNFRDWYTAANFLAYSSNLTVVRVVEDTALNASADGAGILIKNETQHGLTLGTSGGDTAMIAARYPGVKGDSLMVTMADASTFSDWDATYQDLFDGPPGTSSFVDSLGGINDELHVVVVDQDGLFTGVPGAILETFAFVSKASDAKREDGEPSFYGSVINKKSQYIWYLNVPDASSYSDGNAVTAISVTTPGDGYLTAPTVTVVDSGDGTGATATAVLAATGSVDSAVVNAGGTGYTNGDTITLATQNAGTAAVLTVTGETGGIIDTVSVTTVGDGYDTTTGIAQASTSGTGTGATFDLTLAFAVDSITVDAGGSDYGQGTTSITIGAPDATTVTTTQAVATATVAADYSGVWDTAAANTQYKSLESPTSYSLVGGDDGGAVTSDELITGWDMFANAEVVDVSLLIAGDGGGDTEMVTVIKHIVDNIAEVRKDCMIFFSPKYGDVVGQPESTATDNAIATRDEINTVSTYAVMDSGWKYQYDAFNDKYRWVPLNGDIAGLCVRTDNVADPWYSPAGFTRGQIKNAIQLALNPSKTSRDKLYKKSINPVVSFAGEGVLLYGDRTQLTKPSAFQKINVRRLFIVLEKAIATAAKYQLFEFNDSFTRAQFVNMVEPFLREVKGRRGIHDFKVVCDETNNTGEVIDRSEFVGDIYIKPSVSINFMQLNFIAVRTGVEFSEVIGS